MLGKIKIRVNGSDGDNPPVVMLSYDPAHAPDEPPVLTQSVLEQLGVHISIGLHAVRAGELAEAGRKPGEFVFWAGTVDLYESEKGLLLI